MGTLSLKSSNAAKAITILQDYDVAADAKNRISLRGAKAKYFNVKALSNGSYVLEPRVLVPPGELSPATAKKMQKQSTTPRRPKHSAATGESSSGGSFYDKALPILKKAWKANRGLPHDLATNPKYMDDFGE